LKKSEEQRLKEEKARALSALTASFEHEVQTVLTTFGTATSQLGQSASEMLQTVDRTSVQATNVASASEQTNLLALNATIEAARAGDAGKGFAVVASEVKSLANLTSKATEQIASQIVEIQSATELAASAIEGIAKTISDVDEISSSISVAVEEQQASTSEIARSVEQAATGTSSVNENILVVSAAAGDAGEAAKEVDRSAKSLSQQSDHLRSVIDKFLSGVRAA
jgi:methyl-accepting chemotaxis protein